MNLHNRVYKSLDLLALGLLPSEWEEQIHEIANTHAQNTLLDGKSITSREPEGSNVVEVFVVTGDIIKVHLPWLHTLYHTHLRDFASRTAGYLVYPASDLQSSININTLRGKESRYEWHVDSNPLTGLLFVTTLNEQDGGELLFKQNDEEVIVRPKAGTFIAFDAREIPHTVLPLKRDIVRISIPMNYYDTDSNQVRPDDLDSYLYSQS